MRQRYSKAGMHAMVILLLGPNIYGQVGAMFPLNAEFGGHVQTRPNVYETMSHSVFDDLKEELRRLTWEEELNHQRDTRVTGIVSLHELRYPLGSKMAKQIHSAERLLNAGETASARELLLRLMQFPSAEPYAQELMGYAELKAGEVDLAVQHLREAVKLRPGSGNAHSLLGYALCILEENDLGERELRNALALGAGHQAEYWLGVSIFNQSASAAESIALLESAKTAIPRAHLALTIVHAQREETTEMHSELESYIDARNEQDVPIDMAFGSKDRLERWIAEAAGEQLTFGLVEKLGSLLASFQPI